MRQEPQGPQEPQETASTRTRVIERIKHPLGRSQQRASIGPADLPEGVAPEDLPGLPGAEGGSHSASADALPGAPSKDSTPLGDTDQHSDA